MSDINMKMLINNPAYDADWIEKVQGLMVPNSGCKLVSELGEDVNLEKLSKLDCRKLHVLAQFIEQCQYVDIREKMINVIVNNEKLNATQVQLLAMIATNIDYEYECDYNILDKLIDPNISYAKLNYIGEALIKGFYNIMTYVSDVNTDTDQIAAIYATMADNCYDEIDMGRFIVNNKLIINADKINLLRYLCINKMKYAVDISEDLNVKITVL